MICAYINRERERERERERKKERESFPNFKKVSPLGQTFIEIKYKVKFFPQEPQMLKFTRPSLRLVVLIKFVISFYFKVCS